MKTEPKYKPIPRLNPHGSGCAGHKDSLLDCEFTQKDERDLLVSILDRIIEEK